MAKQIILTQNNFGIPIELQFMSNTNSPVDLTDKTVEVAISYDGTVIDVLQATISSYTNGTAYIIVNTKHTSNVGLYTTFWSVRDEYGYITAQSDLYYYVKEEYNGAETPGIEQDKVAIEEKFNEINSSIGLLNEENSVISTRVSGIEIINSQLTNDIEGMKSTINSQLTNDIESMKLTINNSNIKTIKAKRIAHRGYSGLAPENTIPAYEKAAEYGFWGGECDIAETLDHEFVIMHDDTIDRTTNGTGKVSELTLAELKEFNIDSGSNINSYPNLKIPTLEEYLICCKKTELIPVIEVKSISDNNINKFLNIIRSYGLINKAVVISFNYDLLVKLRNKEKSLTLQPLLDLTIENINKCVALGVNTHIDCPEDNVTRELVEYANKKGVLVNAWTVNDKKKLNTLIDYGIDFITTDILYDEENLDYKIKALENNLSVVANQISNIIVGSSSTIIGKTYEQLIMKTEVGNRCSTVNRFYKALNDTVVIDKPSGYKVTLMPFSSEGLYLRDVGWFKNGETDISTHTDVDHYHLYFAKEDGTNFTDEDIKNLKEKVSITFKTRATNSNNRKYNFLINKAPMVLQSAYSEDTCTVTYDGDDSKVFTLTHHKPLTTSKIGVAFANISLASDRDLEIRVKGETKNGFKFGFIKRSTNTMLTETEVNAMGWLYFSFVHMG